MEIKSFHIITIGCQMNKADSERLSSYLRSQGLVPAATRQKADLLAINTCGVRQSAEDRVYGLVNRARKDNPAAKIAVLGCIAKRPDVQARLRGQADIFLANSEMLNIVDIISSQSIHNSSRSDISRQIEGEKYLAVAPDYENNFSAFVPIGNGCNNFCAYCVVPYARGREVYRPAEDILAEIGRLVEKGYQEIMLIAQNVNSYRSGDYDFAKLLEEAASLSGDFWIRFCSSHPKDMSDRLIEVIGLYPKVCPHLHLALQSGDDEILSRMNRRYTAAHYASLIAKVRAARPDIAITTDVIVGFPGETKEQFQHTVEMFRNIEFDMAYIAQYSPRPQTAAWKMVNDVPQAEKRERARTLTDILRQSGRKCNEEYIGKTVRVLIDSRDRQGRYRGKTASAKAVTVTNDIPMKTVVGSFVEVAIKRAGDFRLYGEIV